MMLSASLPSGLRRVVLGLQHATAGSRTTSYALFRELKGRAGLQRAREAGQPSAQHGRNLPVPAAVAGGDVSELPHRRRAAARKAEMAAAAAAAPASQQDGEAPYPTFVPRNAGVTDGAWDAVDAKMVRTAVEDAQAVVTNERIDANGFVLLGKTVPELEQLAVQYGQPKYRGKQLFDAVLNGARTLDDIPNIPKDWKAKLVADGVRTGRSILHHSVDSPDGTRKFLLQLADGRVVETVGIPNDEQAVGAGAGEDSFESSKGPKGSGGSTGGRKRLTVCVSSQVGCPMRCSFCATGKGGFARNLMPHEVLDQVMTVQEQFGKRVSNVVFMGMGEPLLNLPSVTKSYQLLNEQLGIGARFITISTVGVPNAIPRLARANLKSTLAVSIHAPNQALRESIIPSAKAYPLSALMEDCATYYKITGRRVTFEYTLMSEVNDKTEHARELAALLRKHDLLSHINVIPWNPVDESEFKRPSRNRVFGFVRELEAAGLPTTIRVTRGLEAAAACGQLRNRYQKEPLPEFAMPA